MTYFITESYIRSTPLLSEIDINIIVPHIGPSQDLFIQKIIEEQYGESFFSHLLNAFTADTLTNDERTLVLKIRPALAYRTGEQALPFIDTRITNKGIQSQSGEFSQPVEFERMKYLRNELQNKAEDYADLFVKYLVKNRSLFEADIVASEIDGDKSQSNNSFDSGFVFDNPPTINPNTNPFIGFF